MQTTLAEQKILAGLIQSTEFFKEVIGSIETRYFTTQVGKDIARYCIEYFNKYNEAPRENIDTYLYNIQQRGDDDKTADVVAITDRLANKTEVNINYLSTEAYAFFKVRSALELAEKIKEAASSGDDELLTSLVNSSTIVERPKAVGVSPTDKSVYEKAFSEANQSLFGYEGAIGAILNAEFYRGAFFAYIAKTKGGKSFYLMDNAIVAAQQGLKVAYVQAGDMSESAFMKRLFTTMTKTNYKPKYCKAHYSPVPDCKHNQNGTCTLRRYCSPVPLFSDEEKRTKKDITDALEQVKGYTPCTYCTDFPNQEMRYKFSPFYQMVKAKSPLKVEDIDEMFKTHEGFLNNLKVATYDNNSLTCGMVEALLDGWAKHDDFVPDVLIIDYLDIMTDKGMMKDGRQSVKNNVAMGLRRISTRYDLCLITATQADSQGFNGKKLGMNNFRDESKILTHFTAMAGVNQTEEEKEMGIAKMNVIISREEDVGNGQVTICQNLSIGLPIMRTIK